MEFVALHDAVRHRMRIDETVKKGVSMVDTSPALSSDEESALALLWRQLGQAGNIDELIASVGVLEWFVPAGCSAER